jgi:DNA-binding transcriptional regulator YhcF (GntR family)
MKKSKNKNYKYQQIIESIVNDYCNKLTAGSLLPGIDELCNQYSVSQITIKKAMTYLVQHELVKRVPGKGTIVQQKKEKLKVAEVFQKKITINITLNRNEWRFAGFIKKCAERFSKLNPHISFNFTEHRNDFIETADNYDIALVNEWTSQQLAESNKFIALENIPGLIFESGNIIPKVLSECTYREKLEVLPLGCSPVITIYNLDAEGTDKISWQKIETFEQFIDAMLFTKSDALPYPFFGLLLAKNIWPHFIKSSGGELWNHKGTECLLNQPEAIEGITLYNNILHKYNICPSLVGYESFWTLFGTGRFLCTWGRISQLNYRNQIHLGCGRLPYNKKPNGTLYIEGMMVAKECRHLSEIRDFMNYLQMPDNLLRMGDESDGMSVNQRIAEMYCKLLSTTVKNGNSLLDYLDDASIVKTPGKTGNSMHIMGKKLQMMTIGISTPEEVCLEATQEINKLLK